LSRENIDKRGFVRLNSIEQSYIDLTKEYRNFDENKFKEF